VGIMGKTIKEKVLGHLKTGTPLTQYEAIIEHGALRLSATIYKLRQEGHDIETNRVKKGNKSVAEYTLKGACK